MFTQRRRKHEFSIGMRFGRWLIVAPTERARPDGYSEGFWLCLALTEKECHISKPTYGEENHGEDTAPLVSVYLSTTVGPTTLEDIARGLLGALFVPVEPNDSRAADGPYARRVSFLQPVKIDHDIKGYSIKVHGDLVDEHAHFDDVEVGKYTVEPKDGGTSEVKFRIQMRKGDLARWVELMNRDLAITLTPPKAEPLPAEHPDAQADEHQEQLPIGEGNAPNVDPFSGANLSETRDPDESTVDVAATKRRARKANGAEVRT